MTRIAALLSLLLLASAPVAAEGDGKTVIKSVVGQAPPEVGDAGMATKEALIEGARVELTDSGTYLATEFQKREVSKCEVLKAAMLIKGAVPDCSKAQAVVEGVYVGSISKPGKAGIVTLCVTSAISGTKTRFALLFFRTDTGWGLFSEDFLVP